MSQDFADKPARRLSKFSNAGEDRFARADPYSRGEPVPYPAPPEAPAEVAAERLEALAGMVETLMSAPEPAPPSGPRFSRFSHEERFRPLPETTRQPYPAAAPPVTDPGDDPLTRFRPPEDALLYVQAPAERERHIDDAPASRLFAELEDIRRRPQAFTSTPERASPANNFETHEALAARPEAEALSEPEPAAATASRRDWKRVIPSVSPIKAAMRRAKPGARTRHRITATLQKARSLGAGGGQTAVRAARRGLQYLPAAVRVLRSKKLSARYRMALAALHTRILDRRVERLLFVRTDLTSTADPDAAAKDYHYNGPIPGSVFAWALSALPEDLKSFVFVDIRAGNGRTMLLAARRNFEAIQGYAYNPQAYDDLELNIAQYPRSLMTCRNLRAIRGDLEGVTIPDQPCLLFVPNSRRERHLGIILNHVAASFRLNPRPMYLIFDNVDASFSPGHDDIFEPAVMPLPQRVKLALASPSQVKVYKSVLVRPPV